MANFLNNRFMTNTYNPMFPWLNKSNYDKVIAYGNSLWLQSEEEKRQAESSYYRKNVNKMVNDQILDERDDEINQQAYQAATLNSEWANEELRKTEVSQALKRKYNLDAKANDKDLFDDFAEWLNDQWKKLLAEYVAWKSNEFLYVSWLAERPKEEAKKEEETWLQKLWDFATWVAQSPWKWWYNLVWQWLDRAWKEIADKLDWTVAKDVIMDLAKMTFWEDEIKKYQQEKAKQLEEWTAFKGRTQTDITKPILWEERANNWYTKAWEIVWDIASWIALTAPIAAATAPYYATAGLWEAASFWALEWMLDTAITKYWSTWEWATAWELTLWWILWAWWGMLSRYLQNLPKDKADNIRKEATWYIEKSIKPTVKGKANQADYNKFIDDTLDVVDYMDKNKQILQYTDDAWEKVVWKLPTNLRETAEALGNMKKTLYDQYNNIAKLAWDKWARVNMNQAFDKLDDLSKDVSQNIANPQTKQIVENFKNQLLEYTDDAGTIAIEDAQKLTQDFNKQLTAFFRNPNMNDVSKNSIISQLNKWTKDAINESIDDVLDQWIKKWGTASQEYQALKWMYGKIKTIEDEVAKRALVEARKNIKWLSPTILDSFAWWEATEALLTMDVWKLGKAAAMKFIGKYYKYLNDPNTQINNLFKLVQKTNNPNVSQWVIQEWLDVVKNAWNSVLKNTAKPNIMATTAEVLTND